MSLAQLFIKFSIDPATTCCHGLLQGLCAASALASPSFQVREERVGTHESRELGVGLLLTIPVVKNQGRWSKKTEAP